MIPGSFFERDPVVCAAELVGCHLAWGRARGLIVETEAYRALGDEACHTFFRRGAREFVEKHRAGDAYIYLNYGMHWLLNVLVKGTANQGFVLIRALEPLRGVGSMQKRRGFKGLEQLCSGPGKLTQALGIEGKHHGMSLCVDSRHCFALRTAPVTVVTGPRIGITKAVDLPWRFCLSESRYLSSRLLNMAK